MHTSWSVVLALRRARLRLSFWRLILELDTPVYLVGMRSFWLIRFYLRVDRLRSGLLALLVVVGRKPDFERKISVVKISRLQELLVEVSAGN